MKNFLKVSLFAVASLFTFSICADQESTSVPLQVLLSKW